MKVSNAETTKKRGSQAGRKNGSGAAAPVAADAARDSLDRRALLAALQAVADGDFSVRLPGDWTSLEGKIADRFNDIVAANQKMAEELARVGQVVVVKARRGSGCGSRARAARGAKCRCRSIR